MPAENHSALRASKFHLTNLEKKNNKLRTGSEDHLQNKLGSERVKHFGGNLISLGFSLV